ncbi:YidB family protein [Nocardia sp. NPDC049149]|uniref:YidB family protein n=1 Tax=Nocardia sp. NPDC049149 TaxID=3364315 RepID=UPI00371B6388
MDNSTVNDSGAVSPMILTIPAENLAEAALESHAQSWFGAGANAPVTADQVVLIIGESQLAQAADAFGQEPGELAAEIASQLPSLVDSVSSPEYLGPDGEVPELQVRLAPTARGMSIAAGCRACTNDF